MKHAKSRFIQLNLLPVNVAIIVPSIIAFALTKEAVSRICMNKQRGTLVVFTSRVFLE